MPPSSILKFNYPVQGLRGVAAMSVFLFHIYDMSLKQGVLPENIPLPIKAALLSLSSGVDLFFMISGYLIVASLIRHANVRSFLADRIIRIYPVFLFLHISLFAIVPLAHYKWLANISFGPWLLHFFTNLFFLPGMFDLPLLQLNAWSLSYEFAFYLFCVGVYSLLARCRWAGWLLLAAAAPAIIFFYPRAAFFAVGAGIFFLLRQPSGYVSRVPALGLMCVPVFFVLIGYAYSSDNPQLCWLAIPPAFFLFLDITRGIRPLSGILSHKAAQFLGMISYSFYLWHPVVTYPLKLVMAKILVEKMGINPLVAVFIFGALSLAITLPVSYLSYLLLEKRSKKILKKAIAAYA